VPLSKEEIAALQHAELRRESVSQVLLNHYKEYYTELCDLLKDTYWAPYSSHRSMEQQLALYNKGRTDRSRQMKEKIVTNAKPGDSPHNWSCATDWVEFRPDFRGSDLWNKSNWDDFAKAVKQVGLIWGGDFQKLVDKPHCELPINCSWSKIGEIYRNQGYDKAIEAIGQNAIKFKKGSE
jgi:hypothetical protein